MIKTPLRSGEVLRLLSVRFKTQRPENLPLVAQPNSERREFETTQGQITNVPHSYVKIAIIAAPLKCMLVCTPAGPVCSR